MRWKLFLVLIAVGLVALPVAAQNPTGTLSGRVTSEEGDALPGVTVTVSSPALQGTQTATSTNSGDYIFRFLPPGDYTVTFELSGFAKAERTYRVSAAQVGQMDVTLALEAVTEEILVTGAFETLSTAPRAATTYEKSFMEKLPVNRDLRSAVVLTPGVAATGPTNAIVISGSMSFENLFLVNGVVVNENVRGQAFDLFIEDAIQETTTTTSGISAEYGRFSGGVVNVLTKSGGNQFEGSLRANLTNESWETETPLTVDQADTVNEVYEGTFGGYLWKDRAWFFLAGRDFTVEEIATTAARTGLTYPNLDEQQRYEGKLTVSAAEGHRITGSYMEIDHQDGGNVFPPVLDLASVVNRELPQDLLAVHYSGVFTNKFFAEAQYSERHFSFVNSGSQFTDRVLGTLLVDRPTGERWNSPTFCGVCRPEDRDNENYLLKGSWFASSEKLGSHDVVFGYDRFTDIRAADNHQSGSDFRLLITNTLIGSDGVTLFPVFQPGTSGAATIIQWNPIAVSTKGTDLATDSFFVNDAWRFSDRWTFNLGLRYDANDGKDAEGKKVINDAKLSPRLSASFDLKGDGNWIFNASAGEYVAAVANSQADATSRGGVPANITWWYQGPPINTPGQPLIDAHTAIQMLWDWFDSVGGTNLSPVRTISIPGGTSVIADTLASPSTREYSLGLAKRLGSRGLLRVDYVRREGSDFYSERRDLSTGQTTLPNGTIADFSVIENNDSRLERVYDGLHTSIRYRLTDKLDLGGNWTWSHLRGNINGETRASGPVRSGPFFYPEYSDDPAWGNPKGDLAADQRHRVRLWGTYDIFNTSHHGLNVALLQTYLSGLPYGALGAVDTRFNATTNPGGVVNPGYRTPPTAVGYFFTARDAFHTPDIYSTDLALNYSFKWGAWGRDVEIFVQPEVLNVFDQQEIASTTDTFFSSTVCDATTAISATCPGRTIPGASTPAPYLRFNPFTETPVEGVHWARGTNFGQPRVPDSFQTPRTFRVSLGLRF